MVRDRNRESIKEEGIMAFRSPCIELCKFDGKTGLCIGCLRTLDEARSWKKMGDHRRHQIINERPMRETKLARNQAVEGKTRP